MEIDMATVGTLIGTGIAIVGIVYTFLRNFKTDINSHIDRLVTEIKDDQKKMDQRVIETNKRMDGVYHILLKRTETKS